MKYMLSVLIKVYERNCLNNKILHTTPSPLHNIIFCLMSFPPTFPQKLCYVINLNPITTLQTLKLCCSYWFLFTLFYNYYVLCYSSPGLITFSA